MRGTPRWGWSGAEKLEYPSGAQHLLKLLPRRQSDDDAAAAFLQKIGARLRRQIYQDELGPTRGDQTAALRRLIKETEKIRKLNCKAKTSVMLQEFDRALAEATTASVLIFEAIFEAATDTRRQAMLEKRPQSEIALWQALSEQAELSLSSFLRLDTATIDVLAQGCLANTPQGNPDHALALFHRETSLERAVAKLRQFLTLGLTHLNKQRGADQEVAIRIAVEDLCRFWVCETGEPIAHHAIIKDEYSGTSQTPCGKFITQAIEMFVVSDCWAEQNQKLATTAAARAVTGTAASRGLRVAAALADYVKRHNAAGPGRRGRRPKKGSIS